MIEHKYTEGPWKIFRNGLSIGKESDATSICEVWERDGEEGKANARLIASAPDLLDALINIQEYWNRDQNDGAMYDALWHIIDVAENAISKATGGNND